MDIDHKISTAEEQVTWPPVPSFLPEQGDDLPRGTEKDLAISRGSKWFQFDELTRLGPNWEI